MFALTTIAIVLFLFLLMSPSLPPYSSYPLSPAYYSYASLVPDSLFLVIQTLHFTQNETDLLRLRNTQSSYWCDASQ